MPPWKAAHRPQADVPQLAAARSPLSAFRFPASGWNQRILATGRVATAPPITAILSAAAALVSPTRLPSEVPNCFPWCESGKL